MITNSRHTFDNPIYLKDRFMPSTGTEKTPGGLSGAERTFEAVFALLSTVISRKIF